MGGGPFYFFPLLLVLLASSPASSSSSSSSDPSLGSPSAVRVLSRHTVSYSDPAVDNDFHSLSAEYDPRGMQHVYTVSHFFLDLVLRREVLPPSINASDLLEAPTEAIPHELAAHWQEMILQYVGLLTTAACGLLLAAAVPVTCFCVWCCRCAGKCGAYPEHFDKRGDACKRFTLGVLLAAAIVAAMFGVVCAFVTNYFCYEGVQKLPKRLQASTEDTSQYLGNTGKEIHTLLVTNFDELEEVLGRILDESGPILKRSLAEVTQAVAINDLTDIVSNLGNVKRHLKEIQAKSMILQDSAGQLRSGLSGISKRLLQALNQCTENKVSRLKHVKELLNLLQDVRV